MAIFRITFKEITHSNGGEIYRGSLLQGVLTIVDEEIKTVSVNAINRDKAIDMVRNDYAFANEMAAALGCGFEPSHSYVDEILSVVEVA